MAIWKQLIAACAALAMAFASWAWLAPASFPAPLRPLAERAGLLPEADDQQEARGGAPGGGPPGRGGGGPQQVITASVGEEVSSRRVQSVGTAEALRSVSLFAPTAGLVTEMLFTTGDRVAEGQPLLRLDAREETIAVEKAGIALQQARDQLGRFERLSQNQAVSTVQVEEARARVASAEAELRGAELDLDRRTLRAPFDGYMGIPKVTIGDRVTATTEVANIDDRSEILIRYALPERFAAQAQPRCPGGGDEHRLRGRAVRRRHRRNRFTHRPAGAHAYDPRRHRQQRRSPAARTLLPGRDGFRGRAPNCRAAAFAAMGS